MWPARQRLEWSVYKSRTAEDCQKPPEAERERPRVRVSLRASRRNQSKPTPWFQASRLPNQGPNKFLLLWATPTLLPQPRGTNTLRLTWGRSAFSYSHTRGGWGHTVPRAPVALSSSSGCSPTFRLSPPPAARSSQRAREQKRSLAGEWSPRMH